MTLYPEPRLDLLIVAENANYHEKEESRKEEAYVKDKVVNCVQGIGFGITFISKQDILEQSSTMDLEAASAATAAAVGKDSRGIDYDTLRTVIFTFDQTVVSTRAILDQLQSNSYVRSVQELDEGGLQCTYQPYRIGIRTLLTQIQTGRGEEGGIQVTDATGYQTLLSQSESRRNAEIQAWKKSFLQSALLAIPVFVISMILVYVPLIQDWLHSYCVWYITWEEILTWALTTPVQFGSGLRFYKEAYYSVKTRHLGMGFLIAVGTSAAYFYSVFVVFYNAVRDSQSKQGGGGGGGGEGVNHEHQEDEGHGHKRLMQAFETSALLIMFVLLGKYLECNVKALSGKAISTLSQLTPDVATLVGTVEESEGMETDPKEEIDDPNIHQLPEEQIPLVLIQRNDVLLIRPGEKIPIDGVVLHGCTTTDESMLTGESMPVPKSQGDTVIGGTINIDGAVQIHVLAVGNDTTLAKIISLVEEAQSSKAPIQEYADRISGVFVPCVTGFAVLTYVVWAILLLSGVLDGVKESWPYQKDGLNDWTLPLLFSISCLVIACPCGTSSTLVMSCFEMLVRNNSYFDYCDVIAESFGFSNPNSCNGCIGSCCQTWHISQRRRIS